MRPEQSSAIPNTGRVTWPKISCLTISRTIPSGLSLRSLRRIRAISSNPPASSADAQSALGLGKGARRTAIFFAHRFLVQFADAGSLQRVNEQYPLRNRKMGNHAVVDEIPDMRFYICVAEFTGEIGRASCRERV